MVGVETLTGVETLDPGVTRGDVRDSLWDDTRGDAARGDTRGDTGRGVTRGDTEGDLCEFLGLFDGTLSKVTEKESKYVKVHSFLDQCYARSSVLSIYCKYFS